ncbi:MAG: helix-turn-helix domain-containing protein [Solirubrobacteraceae bacterium]
MSQPTTHNIDTSDTASGSEEPGERYITTDQAAEIAGMHRESIRRWIREGELEARKRGRSYDVLESSLMAKLGRGPSAPIGGGIFDPNWGPFTRDPFRRD